MWISFSMKIIKQKIHFMRKKKRFIKLNKDILLVMKAL